MTNKNLPKELRSGDFLEAMMNSPYKLPEIDLKYKNCFFVFIDILGYKVFLQRLGENAPKEIYNLLKNAYPWRRTIHSRSKKNLGSRR